MSLSLALNNALSGLNINQSALAVLSQNIANANTPGYSRKILTQQAIYIDGRGAGVSMLDVTRKVDNYLTSAIRLQGSVLGRADTFTDYADRTQLLLGNPGSQNGLSSYVNNFLTALQTLGQTPESSTLRVGAVNSGVSMAREFSNLSQGLYELRMQTEQDIAGNINAINADLINLQGLNRTIASDSLLGKSVVELEDRRDALLNDLSQYLDIQTYTRSDGTVNVSTGSGVSLLDDSLYQIQYTAATSTAAFVANATLSPIQVYRVNENGQPVGQPTEIVSSGTSSQVVSSITSGKLRALIDLRDHTIPNQLAQLDRLASSFRDEFNRVHNAGTGFPGARSYTGGRSVFGSDINQWSGKMRLAVLGPDGRPVTSPYPDETGGIRPLNIDFSKLNTGSGRGFASVQGLIDEINQYYGIPRPKAVVGALNNIRLASNNNALPTAPPRFNFDFDLENITGGAANFFVTDMEVLDSSNVALTPVTSTIPEVALAATNTFVTTTGSNTVTVNTATPHNFTVGQRVYLSTPPGGPYNGIPANELGGFFTVTSVSGGSFEIEVPTEATGNAQIDIASQTAKPPYQRVEGGDYTRTNENGTFSADLSANTASPYYTIRAKVAVEDANGNIVESTITYQVDNLQTNLFNKRYPAQAVTGGGSLVNPTTQNPIAAAMLVDENGVELPKVNGRYITTQSGFLKIIANGSEQVIALDSLDSAEGGQPNGVPATGRGFSHYFELNNFYNRRSSTSGDDITNAALYMSVQQRFIDNPNLISLGKLVRSAQSNDPNDPPLYTYERNIGDNSVVQQLAGLANSAYTFMPAGGLGQASMTFGAYAGAIIGNAATTAATSISESRNAKALMDGYNERNDSIKGVNLDEELANTIIYQNAYTASTRVISVVDELFSALMEAT
jgi:flagellar hook-associated protein FlgK